MQNIVLVNYLRTAWPTKILMPFLSFSNNLLQTNHIIFQKVLINLINLYFFIFVFLIFFFFFFFFAQNMLNFGLGCLSLLKVLASHDLLNNFCMTQNSFGASSYLFLSSFIRASRSSLSPVIFLSWLLTSRILFYKIKTWVIILIQFYTCVVV